MTVLACIWKQLQAAAPARQVEDWVASLATGYAGRNDGSDFCAARRRLPVFIYLDLLRAVGACASAQAGFFFKGLPVWIADGTTLRTPNTPQNDGAFGRSSNQTRRSRSPILRLVVIVCAGCGAVLNTAAGSFCTSEWELFLIALSGLPRGGLFVADRAYASFLMFALMQQRGSHIVTRHNSRRCGRRLKQLGCGDEIHEWRRPKPSQVTRPDLLAGCPETILVRVITQRIERRGYRTWELQLATSLLDPHAYPAEELAALYLRRWDVELDLRVMKTHYGMARLTGKTPNTIYKEIYSILLACNCVFAVMSESGEPVRTLSHTRARTLILIIAERMAGAMAHQLPALYRQLLILIANAQLELQERPPQPRAIVQRPSTYPVLMMSREDWQRAHCPA
jgi:hypothetical protein